MSHTVSCDLGLADHVIVKDMRVAHIRPFSKSVSRCL